MKRVLIIEDEAPIAKGIKLCLEAEKFHVEHAADGESGYNSAMQGSFDIILLDLLLPKMSGLQVCSKLREGGVFTPIVMLTSKREEQDKVIGLEQGADDYMTKPFSSIELIARINAILRRTNVYKHQQGEYSFGDIMVDFKTMQVTKSGSLIKLSATEFNILKYFCFHEGEVISRNQFLDDVWGYDSFPTTRTVDNYILSLRKKIEDNPSEPEHLLTIHTVGYKFQKSSKKVAKPIS